MLFELTDDTRQHIDGVGVLLGDRSRSAATIQVGFDALGEQLDELEVARRLLRVPGILEREATCRALPNALPPSVTARSAIVSLWVA